MSRLALRVLGFVVLSVAITFASCAAFLRSASGPPDPPVTGQIDGRGP